MPRFGKTSTKRLEEAELDLQMILSEAIKHFDFSIVWTHRGMEAQNRAYKEGNSQKQWPTSKHNSLPSYAVDIVPYPEGYEASYAQFYEMATYVFAAAAILEVPIRWGGHWENYTQRGKMDRDWAHFEKIERVF